MRSICITLTSPFVLNAFLGGHIARLAASFRVVVCINRLESDIAISLPKGVVLRHIEIRRNISPWRDMVALWQLVQFYRRGKFDMVWSITPKAGLLAMIAARIAGVHARVHFFTGQVWATRRGTARLLLKSLDRLLASYASDLLADSPSQRDFLVREGVVAERRITVIGDGSVSGVDLNRFKPDPAARQAIREIHGIPAGDVCLLYVGRMKREKGVHDLLAAFAELQQDYPQLHLLLVGPDEERIVNNAPSARTHCVGYTLEVESYMAAGDIICLPSYREGFGTVLIEGAAAGLAAVASRIYGIEDAVVDGHTGLLHPPGDAAGIRAVIGRLLDDPAMRHQLAANARQRAVRLFAAERVEQLFADWIMARMAKAPPSAERPEA